MNLHCAPIWDIRTFVTERNEEARSLEASIKELLADLDSKNEAA
jgi:hypothetical protein